MYVNRYEDFYQRRSIGTRYITLVHRYHYFASRHSLVRMINTFSTYNRFHFFQRWYWSILLGQVFQVLRINTSRSTVRGTDYNEQLRAGLRSDRYSSHTQVICQYHCCTPACCCSNLRLFVKCLVFSK